MSAPQPLVGPDVDCTDLDGFMLNAERLMASELVALSSHEVIGAALLLWCRAWKQRPAASLPNDDKVIAAFARLPPARFRKLRDEVLRGFVLCSDGRLYHRTLAAEASNAYERKLLFHRKREADAERLRNWRSAKRGETHNEPPSETRFVAEGQGQGQGQGQKNKEKHPRPAVGQGLPDEPPKPTDPGRELWANAVQMLRDQGVSETSARSFIGLQCRTWDEDTVADAFSAAAGHANVKAYVLAVLKGRPKRGEKPAGVEFRNGQATIGGFVA